MRNRVAQGVGCKRHEKHRKKNDPVGGIYANKAFLYITGKFMRLRYVLPMGVEYNKAAQHKEKLYAGIAKRKGDRKFRNTKILLARYGATEMKENNQYGRYRSAGL